MQLLRAVCCYSNEKENYVFPLPTLSFHCFSNTLYGADIKRTSGIVPSRPNTQATLQLLSKPDVVSWPKMLDVGATGAKMWKSPVAAFYLQLASFLCYESVEWENENDGGNPCQRRWAKMLKETKQVRLSPFHVKCSCTASMGSNAKMQKMNIPARGRRDKGQFQWEQARPHWSTPQSPWASECPLKPDSQSRPQCKSSLRRCLSPKTVFITKQRHFSLQCNVISQDHSF